MTRAVALPKSMCRIFHALGRDSKTAHTLAYSRGIGFWSPGSTRCQVLHPTKIEEIPFSGRLQFRSRSNSRFSLHSPLGGIFSMWQFSRLSSQAKDRKMILLQTREKSKQLFLDCRPARIFRWSNFKDHGHRNQPLIVWRNHCCKFWGYFSYLPTTAGAEIGLFWHDGISAGRTKFCHISSSFSTCNLSCTNIVFFKR